MYAKLFPELYTGSMVGAGCVVFAVWPYALANCDAEGYVELNPKLLAMVLGASVQEIEQAITFLMRPDPDSRSKTEDGRRVVKEGQFLYRIVNYAKYREIRDKQDRREYQREWDRENRPSGHKRTSSPTQSDSSPTQSDTVRHSPTGPTKAEVEEDINPPTPLGGVGWFDDFWKTYPKKVAKAQALKAWKKLQPNSELAAKIIASVAVYARTDAWTRDGGQYVPHASTFLNQRRWEDEIGRPAATLTPDLPPPERDAAGKTPRDYLMEKFNPMGVKP